MGVKLWPGRLLHWQVHYDGVGGNMEVKRDDNGTGRPPDWHVHYVTPVVPGVYEHYKGGRYAVVGVAFDANDPEARWVVYMPLQNHGQDQPMLCVRRLDGPDGWQTPVPYPEGDHGQQQVPSDVEHECTPYCRTFNFRLAGQHTVHGHARFTLVTPFVVRP